MRFALLLLFVAGCAQSQKYPVDHFASAISTEVSYAILEFPSGTTTPDVQPNGKCSNCRGTGKIGDGTISTICPVCKGSGKSVVSLVSQPKRSFDCPADCECVFCGCDNGQCGTVAKPANVTTVASGGCANGRCQLPAAKPKKTTVAAPRVTGSCSGGSCSSRGVFRGRLFGRR